MTTVPMHARQAQFDLQTGTLRLEVVEQRRPELYQVAERRNPKRAFLFVSTVLGRHIPVRPAAHRAALQELATLTAAALGAGPVWVMSYAETAIGLGLGVFERLSTLCPGQVQGYLPTTRFCPAGVEPWFEIDEAHSHAARHLILPPAPGVMTPVEDGTLVLVDDEATTGNTFAGLAAAVNAHGGRFGRVVLVTLTDWSGGRSAAAIEAQLPAVSVHTVSLLRGQYAWQPAPAAGVPALPGAYPIHCPRWTPPAAPSFGVPRQGCTPEDLQVAQTALFALLEADIMPRLAGASRVLVIGTGEHVWAPFLAAERLETVGVTTAFIATTRSPVATGTVIRRQLCFADHYGLGLPMYLNNVDPAVWDDILLFTETGTDGVAAELRRALGKGWVIDGAGALTPMLGGAA